MKFHLNSTSASVFRVLGSLESCDYYTYLAKMYAFSSCKGIVQLCGQYSFLNVRISKPRPAALSWITSVFVIFQDSQHR